MKIAFICPTYNEGELHDYTMGAIRTFFTTTANGVVIVVDDASTNWEDSFKDQFEQLAIFPGQQCIVHRYEEWGGLTRSWNQGLRIARDTDCDYAICGNNDIIFPKGWYLSLLHALNNGYRLAGPLSNAPGVSTEVQQVWQHFSDYEVSDNLARIDAVQAYLSSVYMGCVTESFINGFFQMAKVSTWWEGCFSDQDVYRPLNTHNSRGMRNPTPLMTLNEDELQGRWHKKDWKVAVCLASFIFHYRAVTRGDRYRNRGGRWFRKEG